MSKTDWFAAAIVLALVYAIGVLSGWNAASVRSMRLYVQEPESPIEIGFHTDLSNDPAMILYKYRFMKALAIPKEPAMPQQRYGESTAAYVNRMIQWLEDRGHVRRVGVAEYDSLRADCEKEDE